MERLRENGCVRENGRPVITSLQCNHSNRLFWRQKSLDSEHIENELSTLSSLQDKHDVTMVQPEGLILNPDVSFVAVHMDQIAAL